MAYLARLIIHRYAMLGILDEDGYPGADMGILEDARARRQAPQMKGCALPRVRQLRRDPQGRLRFLHRLRVRGGVRLETKEAGAAYTSDV